MLSSSEIPKNEMIAIQVLANASPSGYYDSYTIEGLHSNLLVMGKEYDSINHQLTLEDAKALSERYNQYSDGMIQNTNFLQNGGNEIQMGGMILAGVAALSQPGRVNTQNFNTDDLSEIELNRLH